MSAELPQTAGHWFRQTDKGKGIRLDAEQMDLLNALGVGEIIREAAEFAENPRDFPALPDVPRCRGCGRAASIVYFIQQGASGPIKVGVAADVRKRLWALQTSTPDDLSIRATISGTAETEAALHAFYSREHLRGEWFRASPRLLAYVAELAA